MVQYWISEKAYYRPGMPFPHVSRTGNWADAAHYTLLLIATLGVGGWLVERRRAEKRSTLSGFFGHPQGPVDFVRANWFAGVNQWGISGLLGDTPYGRMTGGASVFSAGSAWAWWRGRAESLR